MVSGRSTLRQPSLGKDAWSGGPVNPWEAMGPTWIQVDLDAIASNFTEVAVFVRRARPERARDFVARYGLRPPVEPVKILAVVKANAYGHGAPEVASTLVQAGADMLGVSTLAEALELRAADVRVPILMINPLTPGEAATAARGGVVPTITDLEAAKAFSAEAGRLGLDKLPVHISVDTGMSRYGVAPRDLPGFVTAVAELPRITVQGLYTHFSAGAERTRSSLEVMRWQLARFGEALEAVEALGIVIPIRHAACSSAVLRLPESYLDMVRVGNLLYGFSGPAIADDGVRPPHVREAWQFFARVLETREVPAGTGVGYGPDVTVRHPKRLGTVPVGYADGVGLDVRFGPSRWRAWLRQALIAVARCLYERHLLYGPLSSLRRGVENTAQFRHLGEPLCTVGRVSMQQTVLDLTKSPEIGVGSVISVRVPRVLASSRIARVFIVGGQAMAGRDLLGLAAEAAVGRVDTRQG